MLADSFDFRDLLDRNIPVVHTRRAHECVSGWVVDLSREQARGECRVCVGVGGRYKNNTTAEAELDKRVVGGAYAIASTV